MNKLLGRLSPEDFARLVPELTRVDLPIRKYLENRNRKIEYVYFPESGLCSAIVQSGAIKDLEVGVIGNEGMTGIPLLHEVEHSSQDTYVQLSGIGWRIPAASFKRAIDDTPTMRRVFLKYAHTAMVQVSFTALAAARQKIEHRLARWLLMAQDRVEAPTVDLTHEFLSIMLAVRRAGVTAAISALEEKGWIETSRGKITIKNREKLEHFAGGGYGEPEAEYKRVLG